MSSFFHSLVEEADRIADSWSEVASTIFSGTAQTQNRYTSSSNVGSDRVESGAYEEEWDDLMDEGGPSPLEGMADSVMKDIASGQSGPQTPWEHMQAFRYAINWTEPFILSLLAFHLLIFTLTMIAIRKNVFYLRVSILCFVMLAVRSSEYINQYCSKHWEQFSTQNYFDRGGVFVGIMFAAPLMMNCLLMLFCLIREASSLLVDVKKMELERKRKKKDDDTQQQQQGRKEKGKKRSKSQKED